MVGMFRPRHLFSPKITFGFLGLNRVLSFGLGCFPDLSMIFEG